MSCRAFLVALASGLAVAAGSSCSPEGAGSETLVLDGLTVIDMTGSPPREGTSIVIHDGRIADLYPTESRTAPAGAQVVDLRGHFAIPGLIDAHVHLTSPFERPGQQDSLSRFLLLGGVTGIRDMAGDGVVLRTRARAAALLDTVLSPRIFYSTVVASPEFFATDSRAPGIAHGGVPGSVDWQRSVANESDAAAAASGAKEIGATGVKLYAELSPKLVTAVAREAHARELKVWSHAAVVPAKPSDAVAAGVDVLSHAFMLAFETQDSMPAAYVEALDLPAYREPPAGPALAKVFAEMHRRGTMLDATLVVTKRLGQGRRVLDGNLKHMQGVDRWAIEAARLAHQAGVRFVAGTDVSGYPGQDELPTLHEELSTFVEQVGMTPAEALAAATRNAAEMLGAEGDLGTIARGKHADLVILAADPLASIRNTRRIAYVVKGGVMHEVGGRGAPLADTLDWKPSWPGTKIAPLRGNLFREEPFAFRFRMPDGYWVHPHRHPVAARLRVITGTLLVGTGTVMDSTIAEVLHAGSEVTLEAGQMHFEGTRGETVVEVTGTGPWGVTFHDPAKDPMAK